MRRRHGAQVRLAGRAAGIAGMAAVALLAVGCSGGGGARRRLGRAL